GRAPRQPVTSARVADRKGAELGTAVYGCDCRGAAERGARPRGATERHGHVAREAWYRVPLGIERADLQRRRERGAGGDRRGLDGELELRRGPGRDVERRAGRRREPSPGRAGGQGVARARLVEAEIVEDGDAIYGSHRRRAAERAAAWIAGECHGHVPDEARHLVPVGILGLYLHRLAELVARHDVPGLRNEDQLGRRRGSGDVVPARRQEQESG